MLRILILPLIFFQNGELLVLNFALLDKTFQTRTFSDNFLTAQHLQGGRSQLLSVPLPRNHCFVIYCSLHHLRCTEVVTPCQDCQLLPVISRRHIQQHYLLHSSWNSTRQRHWSSISGEHTYAWFIIDKA